MSNCHYSKELFTSYAERVLSFACGAVFIYLFFTLSAIVNLILPLVEKNI